MPTFRQVTVAMLATGLALAPALALAAPNTNADGRKGRAQAAFDRMDTNKDGFIDLAEMRTARAALFDRLDTNKDGQLTAEEMRANRAGRAERAGKTQRTISRDEFIGRADQSLSRRDADKDGKLSFAEFSQRKARATPAPTR